MLETLRARKEALEARGEKGFTLMEMLIVIAIIAVLIAIAIPVFTAQLEKAREATDESNIRAAYAEVMANALAGTGATTSKDIVLTQEVEGWTEAPKWPDNLVEKAGEQPAKGKTAVVAINATKDGCELTYK